jgi:hypothetical protein
MINWKGMWNKTTVVKCGMPSYHLPEGAAITNTAVRMGGLRDLNLGPPEYEAGSY